MIALDDCVGGALLEPPPPPPQAVSNKPLSVMTLNSRMIVVAERTIVSKECGFNFLSIALKELGLQERCSTDPGSSLRSVRDDERVALRTG